MSEMLHARPSEQIPGGEVMGDSWEERGHGKGKGIVSECECE